MSRFTFRKQPEPPVSDRHGGFEKNFAAAGSEVRRETPGGGIVHGQAAASRAKSDEGAKAEQKTSKKSWGLSGALAQLAKIPRQFKQVPASLSQFKAVRSQKFASKKKSAVESPCTEANQAPGRLGQAPLDSMQAVERWLVETVKTADEEDAVTSPDSASSHSKKFTDAIAPSNPDHFQRPDLHDIFSFSKLENDGSTASFGSMFQSIPDKTPRSSEPEITVNAEQPIEGFLEPGRVENNGSNIPCVAHSAVTVEIQGVRHYVHANRIHTVDRNPVVGELEQRGIYVAGQSPRKSEALRLLLTHAIDSKQGIFQIIKPEDHRDTLAGKSSRSLLARLSRIGKGEILGERYEVASLERSSEDKVHACYLLTVRSITEPHEVITVPLTQVGLEFKDKLLRNSDIDRAHGYLEKHVTLNQTLNRTTTSEPVVISQAGIGRSATVIVYNTLIEKIKGREICSENALDAALEEQIAIGRRDRGPQFIHSDAQREELRAALSKWLPSASRVSAP
jgi:hypothetical protein